MPPSAQSSVMKSAKPARKENEKSKTHLGRIGGSRKIGWMEWTVETARDSESDINIIKLLMIIFDLNIRK